MSSRRGEGAQTMFVYSRVEEIQTVRAVVPLGWWRQLHDAEPVVVLVECHHGDELVLVDHVSIENRQLPARTARQPTALKNDMGKLRVGIVTPRSRMPLCWCAFSAS